jgi:hypothetical protein
MKKKCSKCKIEKTLDEFGKCRKNKDGLQYACKTCTNEVNKKKIMEKRNEREGFYNSFL